MSKKPKPVFEEIRRNVAGIDIAGHADHYVCGPRLDDGTRDIAHFGSTTAELYRLLGWLKDRNVESVAMESTSVYWIPVADVLEAAGIEVVLVDTRNVRMVPGHKSDVQDCQWLQQLHSCGLLRGGFRPPEKIAAIRTILRERENLTTIRTQCMQQMHKSMDQMNIRLHHAVTDVSGKTGMAIIGAIVAGERIPSKLAQLRDKHCKKTEKEIAEHLTGTWRDEHLFNLEQAHRAFVFIDAQIEEYNRKAADMFKALADESGNPPAPDSRQDVKPSRKEKHCAEEKRSLHQILAVDLTKIDGIDYNTASTIISEIGTDLTRFPTEKHFVSYIGLAPLLGKSAGKNVRQKKKCKNTSRAGQALRMAANSVHKSRSELGALFRNIARRSDRKTAVKATARRMAQLIYRAVRYGVAYIDRGAEAFETRMRQRTVKAVKNLIKQHEIKELELASAFTAN